MITKRDIAISLVISLGCFGISLGVVGSKNLSISILFFVIPLVLSFALFLIFKPRSSEAYDKRWDY